MGRKLFNPGWEWQEGRGMTEATQQETTVWIAVMLNFDDERRSSLK
jgi:hypothetical protein